MKSSRASRRSALELSKGQCSECQRKSHHSWKHALPGRERSRMHGKPASVALTAAVLFQQSKLHRGGIERRIRALRYITPDLGEMVAISPNFLDFSAALVLDQVPAAMHDLRSDLRRHP